MKIKHKIRYFLNKVNDTTKKTVVGFSDDGFPDDGFPNDGKTNDGKTADGFPDDGSNIIQMLIIRAFVGLQLQSRSFRRRRPIRVEIQPSSLRRSCFRYYFEYCFEC